jgi:hypothetical protein
LVENATPTPKWCDPTVTAVGIHNSKLEESTLRILEGGSWKKQDTVILLPAAKMVPMKAALSWMNLMTPPNQSAPKIAMLGMEVGDAYSQAIQQVLDHPQLSTHRFILTLEHDNVPPADGLLKLLAQMEAHPEFACIGGLYWTKGPGGVPQIWGDPKDPIVNFRPQPPDHKGGLVECCGTGMGFNLWRTEMFRDSRLPKPLFRTKCSAAEGVGTQDLAAWAELRKFGYRCAIDCSVLVGHYDHSTDTCW